MKIYTKTGDDGSTGLIGGLRVSKSDPRIECYGTIDELNAAVGLSIVAAPTSARELAEMLQAVQDDLFVAGSHLATPHDSPHRKSLPALDPAIVSRLEAQIDQADAKLPPLRNFILPGGTELAARLHLARTICRRAERLLVAFSPQAPDAALLLIYFNRLSDWLFVQARRANQIGGVEDVIWKRVKSEE
jgi:cob(I)alamin adenosyltransferase